MSDNDRLLFAALLLGGIALVFMSPGNSVNTGQSGQSDGQSSGQNNQSSSGSQSATGQSNITQSNGSGNQSSGSVPSMIEEWATAIEHWENAPATSNNPGNLKYSSLTAQWGATKGRRATDGGSFCQFASYDQGFNALCQFLTLGAKDQLAAFHSARTLGEFTKVYAGNPSQGYINGIATALGVSLNTLVSSFLGNGAIA